MPSSTPTSTGLLPPAGGRIVVPAARRADERPPVICSLATGRHRELLAETAPTLLAYAQRHGWGLVLSSEQLDPVRPPSWYKVKLIQELMPQHEYVFWVDADALVVDLDRDVLAEVDDSADAWFARHPQAYDENAAVLNAGVFLVRSSAFAKELLQAMWDQEQFVEHNWWENAALLHLLGYSLDPPYPKLRDSEWDARIGELDLAWNSVPGYCASATPAVNHHARSDHDDFARRVASLAADRLRVLPDSSPATSRRDHSFTGVPLGDAPSPEQMLSLIDRLDDVNELQRLKITELLDLLEEAVTARVAAERRTGEAPEIAIPIDQYPVFIPVRDRLEPLQQLLAWLDAIDQHEIWLIDNASTYPPLVEFLATTRHHVVRLEHNLGHRSPWLSGTVQRHAHGRYFIVSDPDIVPDEQCPPDVLDHFHALLDRYPDVDKVGFGLRIDDLPEHYALRDDAIDWEWGFWQPDVEVEPNVFRAGVDTTFAMYRPLDRRHELMRALRTGFPYVARHLPWYVDSANLSAEDRYYRAHADRTMTNWDQDELPWWKARRLGPRVDDR